MQFLILIANYIMANYIYTSPTPNLKKKRKNRKRRDKKKRKNKKEKKPKIYKKAHYYVYSCRDQRTKISER